MKRFTETDKWTKDQWFSELDPKYKLFWLFIIDNCDNVGVWEVNKRMANFLIGYDYSMQDVVDTFGDKILVFDDGKKWWIKNFINFQHGKLDESSTSKPIMSYISLLRNHTLWKEYTNAIDSVQGKGTGKGKGIGKEVYTQDFEDFWSHYPNKKGKGGAFKSWKRIKNRPSIEELIKAVEDQKTWSDWTKDGGDYIPHPQTWLNQSRWEDEQQEKNQPSLNLPDNPEDL